MKTSYALAAIGLFVVEVLIALFVHDTLIRPYVGDALAVALVYLTLRAAAPLKMGLALVAALAIATAIEVAQLFLLLDALGLRDNRVARVVLGGTFDLHDFAAYAMGGAAIIVAEALRKLTSAGSAGSTD